MVAYMVIFYLHDFSFFFKFYVIIARFLLFVCFSKEFFPKGKMNPVLIFYPSIFNVVVSVMKFIRKTYSNFWKLFISFMRVLEIFLILWRGFEIHEKIFLKIFASYSKFLHTQLLISYTVFTVSWTFVAILWNTGNNNSCNVLAQCTKFYPRWFFILFYAGCIYSFYLFFFCVSVWFLQLSKVNLVLIF